MNKIRRFFLPLCLALIAVTANGADDGIDLENQRGEVQSWRHVPGHVVDHGGLIVNPTPVAMSVDTLFRVDVSKGFAALGDAARYSAELTALAIPQAAEGLPLRLHIADTMPDGAYGLTVGPEGAEISAATDRGVFYALQTLRQLVHSPAVRAVGVLPRISVSDEPALKYRGLVEGFYGDPWSHSVRKSLIEYLGRNKMNTYVFGPKDDPYHSSPHWREPYPDAEAARISELVATARGNRVNFVWAVHPGKDIRWDEADYRNLLNKFELMYDLGVRAFAIFFDDIEGEGTDPVRQAGLLNRINREFVAVKGDVANLTVCPTEYSRLWASPRPDGALGIYGQLLDPEIEIFYTGDFVCSDLTHDTMRFFNGLVRRPGFYWWNYPVTDYCRDFILQGPVYGLEPTMTSSDVAGILSNPMQHGEASKLALYSLGDYAWNPGAYNPLDSWHRALADLMPEAPDAYRTFAIHNADTHDGYRRDESWNIDTFVYPDCSQADIDSLRAEFTRIVDAPAQMRANSHNGRLLEELSPWLDEFEKLGRRCLGVLDLIEAVGKISDEDFAAMYRANLMSDADTAAYSAHKTGSMKLQPFYLQNMEALAP